MELVQGPIFFALAAIPVAIPAMYSHAPIQESDVDPAAAGREQPIVLSQ